MKDYEIICITYTSRGYGTRGHAAPSNSMTVRYVCNKPNRGNKIYLKKSIRKGYAIVPRSHLVNPQVYTTLTIIVLV